MKKTLTIGVIMTAAVLAVFFLFKALMVPAAEKNAELPEEEVTP